MIGKTILQSLADYVVILFPLPLKFYLLIHIMSVTAIITNSNILCLYRFVKGYEFCLKSFAYKTTDDSRINVYAYIHIYSM